MFLSEPPASEYDLRFNLFGFPVRITWSFWLLALVFGYNLVQGIDNHFYETSPGPLPLLVLWSLAVLLSILVHELGHAFAFRLFGLHASVVLYHFGGLATPLAGRRPGGALSPLSGTENIFIAAAGPAAQLLLAAVVIVGVRLADYEVVGLPGYVSWIPGAAGGKPISDVGLFSAVYFIVFPSIHWAILNLAPVWPLDGGRIARELVEMFGGTVYHATVLSFCTAVGLAIFSFISGQTFLAILFASLAGSSYQLLSTTGSWYR